jgi:hypothetical protein
MNASGKEKIAGRISDVVKKMVTRKKVKPITLKWTDILTEESEEKEGHSGEK